MKQEEAIKIHEKLWRENVKNKFSEYPKRYKGVKFDLREPILDLGGGPGTFMKFLEVKNATIIDLTGNDVLVDKNYKFIKKDLTKKLGINKKYKTIFIMETLEHLHNPLYLLAQAYDLLDDDSKCYISIPYTKLDHTKKKGLGSHINRWKKNELINQLKKLGFKGKIIQKRRRFKNTAFWLPHCWLVIELKKE